MTKDFQDRLRDYAELIVRVGLDLRPGQRLTVRADTEAAPLVRRVAEVAYGFGAPLVEVFWTDAGVTLARFRHAPADSLEEYPQWQMDGLMATMEQGAAQLSISGQDPDLLRGQDPDRVATVLRVARQRMKPYSLRTMAGEVPWCVVGAAVPAWAARVFPELPPEVGLESLWEAIFTAVRLDRADPVAAWRRHLEGLEARRQYLNEKQYRALRLRGPGTDLTVGLVERHVWIAGSQSSGDHVPNLPTEEVFTAPHRERVDGVVRSSRPLSYAGQLLEGFTLAFRDGRVVEARAERGEEALQQLLAMDEGARRLGEVALVPHSSPISRTGVLFFNTLFDENAASHIALGEAYPSSVADGLGMEPETRASAGLNSSLTHVDFMIGSAEMDVDGLTADGREEPVMRAGEWAF